MVWLALDNMHSQQRCTIVRLQYPTGWGWRSQIVLERTCSYEYYTGWMQSGCVRPVSGTAMSAGPTHCGSLDMPMGILTLLSPCLCLYLLLSFSFLSLSLAQCSQHIRMTASSSHTLCHRIRMYHNQAGYAGQLSPKRDLTGYVKFLVFGFRHENSGIKMAAPLSHFLGKEPKKAVKICD